VMLRHDGYVKVLDFGLAKLIERPGERGTGRLAQTGPLSGLPDPITGALTTHPGLVLGTFSYMSPEQSLGQEVDHRSDLFSLGIVMYELVTGTAPFSGSSTLSLLDAIAHKPHPPVTQFNKDLPGELDRILNRALEKDREVRYQTAGDLRAVLKRLQREVNSAEISAPEQPAPSPRRFAFIHSWSKPLGLGALALLLLGVSAFAWFFLIGARTPAHTDWSKAKHRFLTELPDRENNASISPDGHSVIYSRLLEGQWEVFQLRIGGSNPRNLTNHPASDGDAVYSPDGERIAFYSGREGGGIYVMGASGENPRRVTEGGRNPDWSPDGKEIVYSTQHGGNIFTRMTVGAQIWIVNLATNQKRQLATGPDAVQPRWSPHNYRIAYWGLREGAKREIWTVPVTGGAPVAITNDDYDDALPVWSPDGQFLYFSSNRNGRQALWRVALDERTGQTLAEPELVPTPSSYSLELSLAAQPVNGAQRMVYTSRVETSQIFRIAFDAARGVVTGEPQQITQANRRVLAPSVSPNGEWLAYYSFGDPLFNLFVKQINGPGLQQVTNEVYKDRTPRWTPDGQRLVFYTDRSGKYELWTIRPDGSEARQLSFSTPEQEGFYQPVWSPDNQWLAFTLRSGGSSYLYNPALPWNPPSLIKLPDSPDPGTWFMPHNWSFDSQKLVGTFRDQRGDRPGMVTYDLRTRQYERISQLGSMPFWLRDNRHMVCTDDKKLLLVDTQTRVARDLYELSNYNLTYPVLSPDEKWLYFCASSLNEDIWLITL
jgi:eukaryotic-like serine/threonine-protein kinase